MIQLRYGLGGEEPQSLEEIGRGSGSRASACARSRRKALERLAMQREIEALRDAA